MKRITMIGVTLCFGLVAVALSEETNLPPRTTAQAYKGSDYCLQQPNFTESERAGCQIWFYATAGNARFNTYVFQQRLGVLIDWYTVLNSADRKNRFKRWGLINDPACRPPKPGEETYGFDWCEGDEVLLAYVGKRGVKQESGAYKEEKKDPACGFVDAPAGPGEVHDPRDRQDPCDLEFGTSVGVFGLRKFPNPKFDQAQWRALNGRLGTWEGYQKRLADGSVEPPFRIGMACGACHIAFDPLRPPKDPAHPKLENLSGTVGNQYARLSQIFVTGMPASSMEWQVSAYPRPGTVDTSAIPTDQVNNPGTANVLINLARRPTFIEEVSKWRKVKQRSPGIDDQSYWCEPGKQNKCWERSLKTEEQARKDNEPILHILKGGEDSIGPLEALQRVYINIGSCSEEAWVNHLTNLWQFLPSRRNFGQTPFDIGQARRDCPQFRAIEDRLGDVLNFLLTGRPTDLGQARGLKDPQDLAEQLEAEFGKGAVDQGRKIFARLCTRCHSSQKPPFEGRDFRETSMDPADKGIRVDWLGNDDRVPVTEVGTNYARALHSNHMEGHVWQEFGSETLHKKPPVRDLNEPPERKDGGRGYLRNTSLLSVWAHAPFMHNNAIGPELCGFPGDPLYRSPYVDENDKPIPNPPPCWPFDPSVKGRYELFKASMRELLNPKLRIPKITPLDQDTEHIGLLGTTLKFPKNTPAARLGNFRHKELGIDLWLAKTGPANQDRLRQKYVTRYGRETGERIAANIQEAANKVALDPEPLIAAARELREVYNNSLMLRENEGHRFGEDLSDQEKKDLTAFLATL